MIGEVTITNDGLAALATSLQDGTQVKPLRFGFSNQILSGDITSYKASDINCWIQGGIKAVNKISNDIVEFVCDVAPNEAVDYVRTAVIYLDNELLFVIAQPPYAMPPSARQIIKIQIAYANIESLTDFIFIETDITEYKSKFEKWDFIGIKPW